MIESIKTLGEYASESKNPIESLTENPNQSGRYNNVFLICFNFIDDKYVYDKIDLEEFDSGKINKYLYKKGGGNSPDSTPTSLITEIEKTFKTKIYTWFKNLKTKDEFLNNIKVCFEENQEQIKTDLIEKTSILTAKNGGMISIKIDNKYIGEYHQFRNFLLSSKTEKLKEVFSENASCSVCDKTNVEVYGKASPYPFYTLDKESYIAGGFKEKTAWKNFPVCADCYFKIQDGKSFLEKWLDFRFVGVQYYLIPKFILEKKELIEEVLLLYKDFKDKKLNLNNKIQKKISTTEDDILYIMQELKNSITLSFMFYEKSNAAFRIHLLIEDVYPSRLKRLFKAKDKVDEIYLFQEIYTTNDKEKKEFNLNFNFSFVKTFCQKEADNLKNFELKEFLEIINKIFKDTKIDYDYLFSIFMDRIRSEFRLDRFTKITSLKALSLFLFLKELKLLNIQERGVFMENEKVNVSSGGELIQKIETFFSKFGDTFEKPAHRGIFLLGVLTQYLLRIQYKNLGSDPFRKKLKGLRMNEDDIKGLLPKIQNKLEEYSSNYYRELEKIISNSFITAGSKWGLSIDEINYYFILGMNLADDFKLSKGVENE